MRALNPAILTAATVLALSAFVVPVSVIPASAAETTSPAPVSLTQKQIDGVVTAQKEIHDFEATQPESKSDKPDPKADAKLTEIVKKNGFASVDEYAAVLATIGQVMSGIDADTKAYIGPSGVIKKQIAEVEGDTKMPAKEKKETIDELNAAAKTATTDKPSATNIDVVTKNFDALAKGMEAE